MIDTPFQVAQLTTTGTAGVSPTGPNAPGTAPPGSSVDPARIERFQSVFQDAARPATAAQPTQAAQAPAEAGRAEREDALRSLELDGSAAPTATTGDTILGGLSRLREVFDTQHARLTDMTGLKPDAGGLIAAQMEVVQYSLLIDVTSKMTGKATQSFDTLMKGQ